MADMRREIRSILIASLVVAGVDCRASIRASVERFDTPDWAQAGGLELRTDSGGEVLLLRHRSTAQRLQTDYPGAAPRSEAAQPDVVYRYDAASARFERAGAEDWPRAAGEVVDCDLAAASPTAPFAIDLQGGAVLWNGRPLPLAGNTALALAADPSGERVAALSANGARRSSVAPAAGRGGAAGQHFHQVFGRRDAAEQGRAVALPLTSESVAIAGCWSADGRYVIYADVLYNYLCVVDARASRGGSR